MTHPVGRARVQVWTRVADQLGHPHGVRGRLVEAVGVALKEDRHVGSGPHPYICWSPRPDLRARPRRVPRLILLNGLPGSGKSTLARRYADEHPLTLVLDVDAVRGMLGRWLDEPEDAGQLARRLALAMARAHLLGGHDVVVPQFLGRLDFVLALAELGEDVGAEFIETALLIDPQDAARRVAHRQAHPRTPLDHDLGELLQRSGGPAALSGMRDQLLDVVASRPATRMLSGGEGHPGGSYAHFCAALDR